MIARRRRPAPPPPAPPLPTEDRLERARLVREGLVRVVETFTAAVAMMSFVDDYGVYLAHNATNTSLREARETLASWEFHIHTLELEVARTKP